jgi:hypothetical protein
MEHELGVPGAPSHALDDGLIEEVDAPAGSDDARGRYYRVTTRGQAAAEAETRRLAVLVRLGQVFLS